MPNTLNKLKIRMLGLERNQRKQRHQQEFVADYTQKTINDFEDKNPDNFDIKRAMKKHLGKDLSSVHPTNSYDLTKEEEAEELSKKLPL